MKTTEIGITAIQFKIAKKEAIARQARNLLSSLEYSEKCYMIAHDDGSYTDPLVDDDFHNLANLKAIRELAKCICDFVVGGNK